MTFIMQRISNISDSADIFRNIKSCTSNEIVTFQKPDNKLAHSYNGRITSQLIQIMKGPATRSDI